MLFVQNLTLHKTHAYNTFFNTKKNKLRSIFSNTFTFIIQKIYINVIKFICDSYDWFGKT